MSVTVVPHYIFLPLRQHGSRDVPSLLSTLNASPKVSGATANTVKEFVSKKKRESDFTVAPKGSRKRPFSSSSSSYRPLEAPTVVRRSRDSPLEQWIAILEGEFGPAPRPAQDASYAVTAVLDAIARCDNHPEVRRF